MNVFVLVDHYAIEEDTYILGVYSSLDVAEAKLAACQKAEPSEYHVFMIEVFQLDSEPERVK